MNLEQAQRIVFRAAAVEFPWDTEVALQLSFLRTFAVPSIAELLASTGEFTERAQKRRDDTRLLLAALGEHGLDSDLGRRALRRVNRIHASFEIANDDYLYVLSTLVLEPLRWNERFGWRPLTDEEREATFVFWREVGRRMALRHLPASLEALDAFNVAFERERFAYTGAGAGLARATLATVRGGRAFATAVLDQQLLDTLGLSPSPARAAVEAALRGRAKLVARLPRRRRPVFRTLQPHVSYPGGYTLEELGPVAQRTEREPSKLRA